MTAPEPSVMKSSWRWWLTRSWIAIQKMKSSRHSASLMMMRPARSLSRTWSAWPKNWASAWQTRNCRRWSTRLIVMEMVKWTKKSSFASWKRPTSFELGLADLDPAWSWVRSSSSKVVFESRTGKIAGYVLATPRHCYLLDLLDWRVWHRTCIYRHVSFHGICTEWKVAKDKTACSLGAIVPCSQHELATALRFWPSSSHLSGWATGCGKAGCPLCSNHSISESISIGFCWRYAAFEAQGFARTGRFSKHSEQAGSDTFDGQSLGATGTLE